MKTVYRRLTSYVLCFVLLATCSVAAFAENKDSMLEIKIVEGSSTISISGEAIPAEKSFKNGNMLFIPLRAVLEAFGAEVSRMDGNKINITYRDVSMDITVGEKQCLVNQAEKELVQAPVFVNGTTMVPLQLVTDFFGARSSYNASTKTTSILLEDDGALNDLSFLTGSISKEKIGNSYFKWSMNVPKGSTINQTSFNSKYVLVENEQRQISLEVSIHVDSGKKIKDYYNELEENPQGMLNAELLDSSLNTEASSSYGEFLYANLYDEAVFHRVYIENGYIYNIILTSYTESNPQKLKGNSYFKSIMDSFKPAYSYAAPDIQDLSKIKFGLAKYENYINSDTGKKYFTWELSVLPEWDVLYTNTENPYYTEIGTSKKEYLSIEILNDKNVQDIESYGNKIADFYKTNFNEKYFEILDRKTVQLAGLKACEFSFRVTVGTNKYRYKEFFILSDSLIYDITLKTPDEKYEEKEVNFNKMLDTFKLYKKDVSNLLSDMEKYAFSLEKTRVGKNDESAVFENKTYGWSLKLPGYWNKSGGQDDSLLSFSNKKVGAAILVEAVENTPQTAKLEDNEKFFYLRSMIDSGAKPVSVETFKFKGFNVKSYVFRLENAEEETFVNITINIIQGKKYSYSYLGAIPDLCTSESNLKEMKSIWESFTVLP